jgi:alanine dehydrogenase
MDKKTLEFVTFCISKLSMMLKLPQKEIYSRLKKSGILYGYIVPSYDVLHTFSSRYLMEDLTDYMREKGVLEA